jgi:hypothetical protein
VRDALERQHVVLAQRLHRDVPGQHQFVVPLVVGERRQLELPGREHLGVRVGHSPRGLGQVRAVRIPPERHQQVGHRPLSGGQVDLRAASDDVQWRPSATHRLRAGRLVEPGRIELRTNHGHLAPPLFENDRP